MRSPWKTWQRFIVHTQTIINPSRFWRGRNARTSEPDKKPSVSVLFPSNRFPSCSILADTFRETQMGGGTFHLWGFHHREVSPFEISWESQPSTRRASWRCSVDGSVLAAIHPHTSVFNKKGPPPDHQSVTGGSSPYLLIHKKMLRTSEFSNQISPVLRQKWFMRSRLVVNVDGRLYRSIR